MTEKQLLEDWKQYVKMVVNSTSIVPDEPETTRMARRVRLEASPEEWFRYYFPRYTFANPAAFHLAATERLLTRPEHYEVRMWSRELAKSTRTMMETLYLVLAGHPPEHPDGQRLRKKYVLLVSNSADNATRLLLPYKANLEHN
ncbi:MAG: hypothetical protein EBZ77_17010, partial [Chitinophagia bacterium]|nr:hypothetical protein [Chitinophagia bacterium]